MDSLTLLQLCFASTTLATIIICNGLLCLAMPMKRSKRNLKNILLVNTLKLTFILWFVEECILQLYFFSIYTYSSIVNVVLTSIVYVAPLLLIILYLFNVKLSVSSWTFGLVVPANVMAALIFGFNGWGFKPVIAWPLMFWAIVLLGHKLNISSSDRLYLAAFSILPATVLWELSWDLVHLSLSLEYFVLGEGTRLLCLPFLVWQLKGLGWHYKPYMPIFLVVYTGWMLTYPFYTWPFEEWFVRLPAIFFSMIVMFGGLSKNER